VHILLEDIAMQIPVGFGAAIALMALFAQTPAVVAQNTEVTFLFIKTADSMTFDGTSITLSAVDPNVYWFTDRPARGTGQLTLTDFIGNWTNGKDSFEADPPNVVVTVDGSSLQPAVVEITNPRVAGDDISYDVEILAGNLPDSGGRTVIVIDGLGCNYCPVCDWTECE
jgi:hypothetical protein